MQFLKNKILSVLGFLSLTLILGCSSGRIGGQSACGNGVREGCEQCDGVDLGVSTCAALGYAGGTLACLPSCLFDESDCRTSPACGDNTLDPGEQCDGAQLGATTCRSLGFDAGELSCFRGCTFDQSTCRICGNGVREVAEECDGADLGGASCAALGHSGGTLGCLPSCRFDEADCLSPLRFITVGEPHVGASADGMSESRLARVVQLVNQSNVDFVVLIGDLTNGGNPAQYESLKTIMKQCNKPVKYVIGCNDLVNEAVEFEKQLGQAAARVEHVNGYQLLFIGVGEEGGKHWVFNFEDAAIKKDAQTLVFMNGSRNVTAVWETLEETKRVQYPKFYPYDIKTELDKFRKVLGVYSARSHQVSFFDIDGVKWIENGSLKSSGISGITFWNYTTHVGYTKIENGIMRYTLVPYEDSSGKQVGFSDPFP